MKAVVSAKLVDLPATPEMATPQVRELFLLIIKKHMYLKHRDILDISQPAIPPPINPVTATAMENPDDEPALEMPESQVSRKVSAALFIMKAKEVNKIHNPV